MDQDKQIEDLKKQIQNQKEQLLFYLRKNSGRGRINRIAETCSTKSGEIEDDIPLNFAMRNFCKRNNVKTSTQKIYEYMMEMDKRLKMAFKKHDKILKRASEIIMNGTATASPVGHPAATNMPSTYPVSPVCNETDLISGVCEADPSPLPVFSDVCNVLQPPPAGISDNYWFLNASNMASLNPTFLLILGDIFNSTFKLKDELGQFRKCTALLADVECRRNQLVEQVYSLSTGKRMECQYLMSAEAENFELADNNNNMLDYGETVRQQDLAEQISPAIDCVEIGMLDQIETDNGKGEQKVSPLVEDVDDAPANALVSDSVPSCCSYSKENSKLQPSEISSLRAENLELRDKIESLNQEDLRIQAEMEKRIALLEKTCFSLTESMKEISERADIVEGVLQSTVEETKKTEEDQKISLGNFADSERIKLERKMQEQNGEIDLLRAKLNFMDILHQERDYYKKQVSELRDQLYKYGCILESLQNSKEFASEVQNLAQPGDNKEMEKRKKNEDIQLREKELDSIIALQDKKIKHLLKTIRHIVAYMDKPITEGCVVKRRMVDERLGNLNNRLSSDQSSITPTCDRVTSSPTESLTDQSSNSASKDKVSGNGIASAVECKRSKSLSNTSSLDLNDDTKLKADVKKCRSNPVDGELIQRDKDFLKAEEETKKRGNDAEEEDTKAGCSSQREAGATSAASSSTGLAGEASPRNSEGNREELIAGESSSSMVQCSGAVRRLKQENERLQVEVTRLRRLVVAGATTALTNKKETAAEDQDDKTLPEKVIVLEHELQLAREALISLKSDRKRLKAEKFDLLNQMKQLYAILEDKEKELRDFIRNYEQRVRESETSLQQLSTEREERERERWSLLRHARDEAERSLSLAAQLNSKELQLKHAQEQLQDSNPLQARRQLVSSGCLSDQESLASMPRGGAMTPGSTGFIPREHHGLGIIPGDRNSCSADSGVRCSSDRESGATSAGGNLSDTTTDGAPTITVEGSNVDVDSISVVSSIAPSHLYQSISTPKDSSPTLSPLNANVFSRSIDTGVLSRSVEQLASPVEAEPIPISRKVKTPHSRLGGRGGTWGSISRVFARSRHRNKANSMQDNSDNWYDPYRSWSPLTEEGYTEKLRLLREASTVPMERWRAPTVLAWLEIALGMPQYGPRFAENVKSGKIRGLHGQVLLELSDIELECGLGITHPMHRKKLRLAIEEHRHPTLIRYPSIAQLGHTWVSSEWLHDIGLSQYTENFASNMVDARMLDNISKKELEKFLGVTRKFHQASIVHGIHLLRIVKYDRQALSVRRHQCENLDVDPLVWTNRRFIRWARNIDLGEYADNLKDSGVHGGLVVLEPSFNGDTMATALGIPTSKNIIRRHLAAELESLILPARSTLEHYIRIRSSRNKSSFHGTTMGKSYSRSCAAKLATTSLEQNSLDEDTFKNHFTGTLSRAFGFSKSKNHQPQDLQDKHSPTSSSETSSIASYVSLPQSRLEGPLYGRHVHGCKMAEDYESRPPSSISTSNINKKDDNGHSSLFSGKGSLLSNLVGGSLHRSKKRHRRVKSISDIDVMNLEQLML